jgi:hypothetical protein
LALRGGSTAAHRWCATAALVLFVAAPAARAQTAGPSAAEILFEQGRTQMAGGDYVGACPKFEESYRLDQAHGTLLALALCHEAQGRWASAWKEFVAVQAASARDGRTDRAAVARTNLASLEPKVSKVILEVSPETRELSSFDVECDGSHVDLAAGDLEVPVDPGTHLFQASAPGHVPWATTVQIGSRSERPRVQVPELEPLPAAAAPLAPVVAATPQSVSAETAHPVLPPTPPASAQPNADAVGHPSSSLSAQRIAGIVVAGLGAVAMGIGAGEGLHAIAENNDARSRCPASPCANVTGLSLSQGALGAATASDILLGAGAVTLAVGGYFWFSGGRSAAAISLGPRSAQLHLEW